jgi:hypothetical protein
VSDNATKCQREDLYRHLVILSSSHRSVESFTVNPQRRSLIILIEEQEKTMKFLILAKFRVDALWRPGEPEPQGFTGDLDGGYVDFENMFGADKLFEFVYGRVGGGWVGIANVDSARTLWEKLTADKTLYSLFEWHIEPLIEADITKSLNDSSNPSTEDLPTIFPQFMQSQQWNR